MKRVLFIAFYFPPRNNVACYRSGCFAKFLPDHGWLPTVVCQDWPADRADSDPDFVGKIPEAVQVHRIPAPPEQGAYERIILRKLAPYLTPHRAPILWWRQARRLVDSLTRETKFDAVWATSDPLTPLTLGLEAAHRAKIPWTADIRDCLNVQKFGSWYKRPFFRYQERRLCRAADRVITVSDGLRKALHNITGAEVSVIPNGFDPSLLPLEKLPATPRFTILHAGTLVTTSQDPRPFFRALESCIGRGQIPRSDVEILFLGTRPESLQRLLSGFSNTLPVRVLPRLPHRAALALQTQASALLLLADRNREGVMTGKVFDYLAAGRPILAVPDDLHTTSALLKATGAGVALSDVEAIARSLTEWYVRWRSDRFFNLDRNELEIARYSRAIQTGELARIFDELTEGTLPQFEPLARL
jgi:glycosyltransferase involved in cell wall biosynthesis